jgi:two-component system OmpR family response regulator
MKMPPTADPYRRRFLGTAMTTLAAADVADMTYGYARSTGVKQIRSGTVAMRTAASLGHVLVVDDDPSTRELLERYLGENDLRVTTLASGRQIAEVMAREIVDLLMLDPRLPGEDGMQIAQRLRADSDIPIIMVTGRKDEADRVMGLELGADDYVTKPFSPRELLARVRALLRRARVQQSVAEGLQKVRAYRFAGWELNVRLRRLTPADAPAVPLTNSEFKLLAAFLSSPQQVLSRDRLLSLSRLHNDEVYDRAIDVQVGRLRKKLERDAKAARLIQTARGAGYAFIAAVEAVR